MAPLAADAGGGGQQAPRPSTPDEPQTGGGTDEGGAAPVEPAPTPEQPATPTPALTP